MRLVIGCDHAGLNMQAMIIEHVSHAGYNIAAITAAHTESVDYPCVAQDLAQRMLQQYQALLGILICGTGVGMSIAANRFVHIRAALCTDIYTARMARSHNDANVLCLGARVIEGQLALSIVDTFLNEPFSGAPRHAARVAQLTSLSNGS